MRSTSEDVSVTNHSNFRPAYETFDIRRGRDNKCPLLKIDVGVQTAFTGQDIEHEDRENLQHVLWSLIVHNINLALLFSFCAMGYFSK